ncbi:MAG: acyl-ACP--UDP-N-acetylglucosamine O-acyltransferase [Bacteroidales bacterium]|nr:MAG: acyl-ACP--UDP-N-acetylglucosamine O-acyltransferase [Bacteroidales bacterium]
MNNPLSNIHPKAKIGKNVNIESFVSIAEDVEIGEGTWVGPNVTIMDGTKIGKNCKIFPGAVISAIPQDLKFKGEKTTVTIGDNTSIRECVTINRGTATRGETVIGNNCLLMAYVHIAHDCVIKNNVILSNCCQIAGEVEIGDWAYVGGMSVAHQFSRIGKHVFISGKSGILIDVPPYIKAAGIPVAYIGINAVGLRRREFTNERINEIQEIYRVIYNKGMNNSQAIEYLQNNYEAFEERDEIINFFETSKRGIIKARQGENLFG